MAHTLWQPSEDAVQSILSGAWDVVPALMQGHLRIDNLSPDSVTACLDEYVRDLAITGQEHTLEELSYRFEAHLGIGVPHDPAE